MKLFGMVLAAGVMASAAQAEGLLCKMNSHANGFIPSILAIQFTSDTEALVIDTFIAALEQTPRRVAAKRKNNGAIELSWNLTMPTSIGDKRVRFRATLDQGTQRVAMSARLRHATNHERGSGTCVPGQLPKAS